MFQHSFKKRYKNTFSTGIKIRNVSSNNQKGDIGYEVLIKCLNIDKCLANAIDEDQWNSAVEKLNGISE